MIKIARIDRIDINFIHTHKYKKQKTINYTCSETSINNQHIRENNFIPCNYRPCPFLEIKNYGYLYHGDLIILI